MSRTFHISVKIWAMLPKCCALLLMLLPTSAAAAVECIEDGLKLAEDVNQYRMDAGLAPLKVSPSLIEARAGVGEGCGVGYRVLRMVAMPTITVYAL